MKQPVCLTRSLISVCVSVFSFDQVSRWTRSLIRLNLIYCSQVDSVLRLNLIYCSHVDFVADYVTYYGQK
jgi:hypothetical protein